MMDRKTVLSSSCFTASWNSHTRRRNQVGPLADDGWRVLVPDQIGYNLSDKPADLDSYDIDALADDVLRLARSAGRRTSRWSAMTGAAWSRGGWRSAIPTVSSGW